MSDSGEYGGSCVCGAVHFRVTGAPLVFQYCHCSRCRKDSGSAHGAKLFVPVAQFAWERGDEHVTRYELESAKYWSSAFCTKCGSKMPWVTRNGKTMCVPAGSLDDDPNVGPSRNIFFGSRAAWYSHASELEVHDDHPPR